MRGKSPSAHESAPGDEGRFTEVRQAFVTVEDLEGADDALVPDAVCERLTRDIGAHGGRVVVDLSGVGWRGRWKVGRRW
jgi:hypothetical protein